VGGRYLNDTVVTAVHVYDLQLEVWYQLGNSVGCLTLATSPQTWSTLDSAISTSDLTAFLLNGEAYIVGGYDQSEPCFAIPLYLLSFQLSRVRLNTDWWGGGWIDYQASAALFKFNPQSQTFEDANIPMTFARGFVACHAYMVYWNLIHCVLVLLTCAMLCAVIAYVHAVTSLR
jgi:hypothetical protein